MTINNQKIILLSILTVALAGCGLAKPPTFEVELESELSTEAALLNSTKQVLSRECLQCHVAGGGATRLDFQTTDQFIQAGLIVPGDPRSSKLIYRLKNFPGTDGSNNMPSTSRRLSDNDYQVIYSWINNMPSGRSPFTCVSDRFDAARISSTHAKRLTNRQYNQTLLDLLTLALPANTSTSLVSSAMAGVSLPTDTGQTFSRENNSFTGNHADAYFEIANRLATSISSTHLSAFVTQFINIDPRTCTSINLSNLSQACRDQFTRNFVGRAFRRPLREASQGLTLQNGQVVNELTQYGAEFTGVSTQEAVNRIVFRTLLAPHFLFLIEDQNLLSTTLVAQNTFMLSPFAFINRLTYRFWNTMPDAYLWQRATTANFANESTYVEIVNYIFSQDAKLDSSMREYMHDWLKLSRTPRFSVNNRFNLIAPGITFNDSLRSEMIREVEEFGSYTVTSGGSFMDLFLSDISFARSNNLRTIYGNISAAPAYSSVTANNAVRFPASHNRAGILTRAAMLVSGSEFANPIIRGVHLRKDILCLDFGASAPPNALDQFNEVVVPHHLSTRERVDIKTSGTSCVGCHSQINPLGFAFSNFNSFGMHIQQEPIFNLSNPAIDQYVNFVTGVDLSRVFGSGVTANNAVDFSQLVAQQSSTKACFSQNVVKFAYNRSVSATDDACKLDKVYDNLDEQSSLIEMLQTLAIDMEMRVRKTR